MCEDVSRSTQGRSSGLRGDIGFDQKMGMGELVPAGVNLAAKETSQPRQ